MGLTVILTRFDPNFVIDNALVLIDWKALVPKFILSFGNTLKKNRPGWCYVFEELRMGTQLVFNYSNSTKETTEQCVKSV